MLDMTGAANEVNFGDSTDFEGLTNLTIAIWVKSSQGGNPSGVITKDGTGTERSFGFYLNGNTANKIYFFVFDTANTFSDRNSSATINDGNWHYVVATWNGTTGNIDIYVDGVLSNGVSNGSNAIGTIKNSTADILMGDDQRGGAVQNYNGYIGECEAWSVVLTADEITEQYGARLKDHADQVQIANRVERWPCDDGSNGTAIAAGSVRGVWNGNDGNGGGAFAAEENLSDEDDAVQVLFPIVPTIEQLAAMTHNIGLNPIQEYGIGVN
jgi:hypothetical protein